ncbi:MAG: enolase [Candidatus Nitrosocaldaceae archaeon]|nr:MAG: enolase [Candidatus Nitrosocaldaceae archaeon]
MPNITDLKARVCYNSRGQKSIEVDVITDNKYLGRAAAPSGASTGRHEAISFPKGVEETLRLFNINKSKFIGLDAIDQYKIYQALRSIDDTSNYAIIGGSVAYALSIAAADSAAKALGIPLFKLLSNNEYKFPYPLGNVLGGGAHAGPGTPDIQEFLVVPRGAKDIMNALEMNFAIHKAVKDIIVKKDKTFTFGRGDEGAWAPKMNNEEALNTVEEAINELGYQVGKDIAIGIDFASSSLWDEKEEAYIYARSNMKKSREEQIDYVSNIIKDYKLIYAEDPVHEEAFDDMAELTKRFPNVHITGDDLLVTNVERLKVAIEKKACNAAILKVNQAGSLYDALKFAEEANKHNIRLITSHRSGESIDAHITHIAIATNSCMLKAGVVGGERVAKLNELIRINERNEVNSLYNL